MSLRLPILCCLLFSAVFSAFSASAQAKPKVVATISIIGDLAHQVGGDDIELATLVGPDGDPHEYEPVPADSIKLGDADLIFEDGLGLETWLDKLCTAAGTKAVRVVVTSGVHAIQTDGDRDPHAWHDVKNVMIMVDNIRDALVKLDPPHAEQFKTRAAAYQKQLAGLDAFVQATVDSIPKGRRKLVTSHNAFGYFGHRYGMEISRGALESVTTEAADPSARQVADAVDQIKASGVPVIFVENIQNPKLTQQIADEARVKLGPPLYSDALGQPGSDGDTYLKMMRYNATAIATALK